MKRTACVLFLLLLASALTSSLPVVEPQAPFWIGLNLEVDFRDRGVVTVVLKQHPFDNYGNSLISDESVVREILQEEDSIIESALLLFATTPYNVRYNMSTNARLDGQESVTCNVGTFGGMKTLRGAIVLSFDMLLNTTDAIQKLGDDVYRVVVTDFFTVSDPRSWLDVVEFRFSEGVSLLNFSWDPSWAKSPTVRSESSMRWVNENEADAPDHYIFTLKIPGVVFSSTPLVTRAEISDVEVSAEDVALSVKVRNTGDAPGTFIVRVLEGGYDQARKLSLSPGEEVAVKFPLHIVSGEATVQLIVGSLVLEERHVDVRIVSAPPYYELMRIFAYALLVAGAVAMLLFLRDLRRKGVPPPPPP